MPVYKLENEMPYTELMKWIEFFKRRPVGWREDSRTAMLMRAQGVKAKGEDIFPSLRIMKEGSIARQENDRAVPKGKFFEMMTKSKTGDAVSWLAKEKKNDKK